MARVLIVGCGCRGRTLGSALKAEGHMVRGTSRNKENLKAASAVGIESVNADPARLAQVMQHVEGVTVVVWLMGAMRGDRESISFLHDAVLAHLLEKLVDTQVRGFVYESSDRTDAQMFEKGREHVTHANRTWHIPVAFIDRSADDHTLWLTGALTAVKTLM